MPRVRGRSSPGMATSAPGFASVHPLAPESLFMTGKILDYGCLNHFKEAIVQYEACYQKYPDTEFGKMARERYDRLLPFMSGGAHGGGGGHP